MASIRSSQGRLQEEIAVKPQEIVASTSSPIAWHVVLKDTAGLAKMKSAKLVLNRARDVASPALLASTCATGIVGQVSEVQGKWKIMGSEFVT